MEKIFVLAKVLFSGADDIRWATCPGFSAFEAVNPAISYASNDLSAERP